MLKLVEQQHRPCPLDRQLNTVNVDGVALHLPFISTQLWAFVGNHLGPLPYSQRLALVGGEDYNGLELWRKLYLNNEGGAEQVALAGLERVHN